MPTNKILLMLCCVLVLIGTATAEVPRLMNYQGVLTDAEGIPTSGKHDLTFRMYGGKAANSTVLWEESHEAVEISGGIFMFVLCLDCLAKVYSLKTLALYEYIPIKDKNKIFDIIKNM